MAIAIVTGASSGMGAEFCRRIDDMGYDSIWLVARRKELMDDIASKMKTETRVFPVDLADRESLDAFTDVIKEERPEIGLLISNAGFGILGKTWEIPLDTTRSMIDVNVTASVTVTMACIPYMKDGGHIIQTASLAAYAGIAELNVYASTKAFMRSFCTGLREELKPRSISVTEVSPGFVDTDFIRIAKNGSEKYNKIIGKPVTKEDVVDKALKAAFKGKRRSVCGIKNRLTISISTHMYNTAAKVAGKITGRGQ